MRPTARRIPAHQRLEADQHRRAQGAADLHLGLVDEAELLVLQAGAQRLLGQQRGARAALEALLGELQRGAGCVLGLVHRRVGRAQQRLGVAAVRRVQRHAHRHVEEEVVPRQRHRLREQIAHRLSHLVGHVLAVLRRREQGELVLAQPHGLGAAAQGLRQARRERTQHLVADRVAVRLVEELEAVDVEQQQREALAGRAHVAQPRQQRAAVGQAGQLVVGGLVQHRRGGVVLRGLVADDHLLGGLAVPVDAPGREAQADRRAVEAETLARPVGPLQLAGQQLAMARAPIGPLGLGHGGIAPQRAHVLQRVQPVDAQQRRVGVEQPLAAHHRHALVRVFGQVHESLARHPRGLGRAAAGGVQQRQAHAEPDQRAHQRLALDHLVAEHEDLELVQSEQHQQQAGQPLGTAAPPQPGGGHGAHQHVEQCRDRQGPGRAERQQRDADHQQRDGAPAPLPRIEAALGQVAGADRQQARRQQGHGDQRDQPGHAQPGLGGVQCDVAGRQAGMQQEGQADHAQEGLAVIALPGQQQGRTEGQADGDVEDVDRVGHGWRVSDAPARSTAPRARRSSAWANWCCRW